MEQALEPIFRFDTGQLGGLRHTPGRLRGLQHLVANLVEFRVVIDANCALQNLIYRERFPERGATALEEAIRSTIIEVHAPRWPDAEMLSAIPQAAAKTGLSALRLWEHWFALRLLLRWDETLIAPESSSEACCDPKDVPYVTLENKVDADGILSQDRHIAALGGHALKLDFVRTARDYARATATTVCLRALGTLLPTAVIMALVDVLRRLARAFVALPPAVKTLILLGTTVALLHPGARKWIGEQLSDLGTSAAPLCSAVLELVRVLSTASSEAQTGAALSLQRAKAAVRPRAPVAGTSPRARRRRARGKSRVRVIASPAAENR